MFRNLNEDDGCFVNEALEIDEKEGDKKENKEDLSTIKIEIFRSKYDQQKLNEEMLYKKPSEKPSKYMLQVQGQTLFIRRVNSTLINEKKKHVIASTNFYEDLDLLIVCCIYFTNNKGAAINDVRFKEG